MQVKNILNNNDTVTVLFDKAILLGQESQCICDDETSRIGSIDVQFEERLSHV